MANRGVMVETIIWILSREFIQIGKSEMQIRPWSLHEKPAGDLTYCPYQANLPCLKQVVC